VDIILVSLLVVNGDFTEKREEEHARVRTTPVGGGQQDCSDPAKLFDRQRDYSGEAAAPICH
jgi:hypothetical protein